MFLCEACVTAKVRKEGTELQNCAGFVRMLRERGGTRMSAFFQEHEFARICTNGFLKKSHPCTKKRGMRLVLLYVCEIL